MTLDMKTLGIATFKCKCKKIPGPSKSSPIAKNSPNPVTLNTQHASLLREGASLEESQINITLDGCTYPGQKLAQFILSKKTYNVNKTLQLKTGKGAGIWGQSHKTFLE